MKILLLLATALPFIVCSKVLLGGHQKYDAELTDPFVVFAVQGINDFKSANGDIKPRHAVKILSASSQIVSGVLYTFEIEIFGDTTKEVCSVQVWSKPWLDGDQQTVIHGAPACVAEAGPVRKARGLLGGQRTASLSDDDVQKAVAFLETKHNARSNNLYYFKVTGASRVTKQVVNGVIFRFSDVTYAQSSCRKNNPNLENSQCVVSSNAATAETCTSQVYWNPRETPEYTLTSETCSRH